MFSMTELQIRRFRYLVGFVLITGAISGLYPSESLNLSEVWPSGSAVISLIFQSEDMGYEIEGTKEFNTIAPNCVILNEANSEELMACPGISSKTAKLILFERKYKKFLDWRDFKDRIKMRTSNIERMQDAGVRLNKS